jgi:ADP-heptose:LPS heptosyltransferase
MLALEPERIRHILVVKLSSLGDIVHVTPCLRALRQWFTRARITMAVDRCFAGLVRHDPHLDGLIEAAPTAQGWAARTFATLRSLAPHARGRFDLAIDFQGVRRSALYVYLSRAAIQAGRGGLRPGWDAVVRPDLTRHAVEVCADIARALAIPMVDLDPVIHLSREADAQLGQLLQTAGLPPQGFLLINPFSRWRSKEWPLDRYARLVQRLQHDAPLPVVISGSRDRQPAAARLERLLGPGRAVSLVGKLSLEQAVCLYRRAGVLVTGDSGPMHVAAALGTKLVALFGPTLPERTGPWGRGHRILQMMRPDSHYAYRTDWAGEYISAIDVDSVYQTVRKALEETS